MPYYQYPPSPLIQRYGQLVDRSHQFIEGKGKYLDYEFDCQFEVAQTTTGMIILVCYFQSGDNIAVANELRDLMSKQHPLVRGTQILCDTFIGRSIKNRQKVEVYDCHIIDMGGLLSPIIFSAKYFISIEHNVGAYESDKFTKYAITGMDCFDLSLKITNNNVLFSFEYKPELPRVLGTLVIDEKPDSELWASSVTVELVTAFLSLAVGKQIRWIRSEIKDKGRATNCFRTGVETHVEHHVFTFMNPEESIFYDNPKVISFVETCLTNAMSSDFSQESLLTYAQVIHNFVRYQLVADTKMQELQLVIIEIEAVLMTWLKDNNLSSNDFDEDLKAFFQQSDTYLPTFEARLTKVANFRNYVGSSFAMNLSDDDKMTLSFDTITILPAMMFILFDYTSDYFDLSATYAQITKDQDAANGQLD